MVHFPIEKRNCSWMSSAIREFSGFIDEFDVNPPLGGGVFTWCGEKDGSFKARLDSFLSSNNLEEHFLGEVSNCCQGQFSTILLFSWCMEEKGKKYSIPF